MPFVTLLITVLGSAPLHAAECTTPAHRGFDFWLGTWEVRLADGSLAGRNVIEVAEQGCLLTERWRSAQGGTGFSMNFYDPLRDRWRQVWVSPGILIDIEGQGLPGIPPGRMALEGTITYTLVPEQRPFRGTWTLESDGVVRQHFEEQREGVWSTWFDGFYRKDVE
jgi:hypothetical protein